MSNPHIDRFFEGLPRSLRGQVLSIDFSSLTGDDLPTSAEVFEMLLDLLNMRVNNVRLALPAGSENRFDVTEIHSELTTQGQASHASRLIIRFASAAEETR